MMNSNTSKSYLAWYHERACILQTTRERPIFTDAIIGLRDLIANLKTQQSFRTICIGDTHLTSPPVHFISDCKVLREGATLEPTKNLRSVKICEHGRSSLRMYARISNSRSGSHCPLISEEEIQASDKIHAPRANPNRTLRVRLVSFPIIRCVKGTEASLDLITRDFLYP